MPGGNGILVFLREARILDFDVKLPDFLNVGSHFLFLKLILLGDNCFIILVGSAMYQHQSAIGTHMSPPS